MVRIGFLTISGSATKNHIDFTPHYKKNDGIEGIEYTTNYGSISITSLLTEYPNVFLGTEPLVLENVSLERGQGIYNIGDGSINAGVLVEYLKIKRLQKGGFLSVGKKKRVSMDLLIGSKKRGRLSLWNTYTFGIKNKKEHKTLEDYFEQQVKQQETSEGLEDILHALQYRSIDTHGFRPFVLKSINLKNIEPPIFGLTPIEVPARILPVKRSEINNEVYFASEEEINANIRALVDENGRNIIREIQSSRLKSLK
jgi:hypothetical protein